MSASAERPIERCFARYAADHRHPANQLIHLFAVPALLWSVVALLWCVPVLGTLFKPGVWAALAMFAAWAYYNRLSRPIGYGMLAVFFFMGCLCRLLHTEFGLDGLFKLAAGVFVLAWVAQFIGHSRLLEGCRPGILADPGYLLIGPIWVLAKFFRHMGWKY